MGAPYMEGRLRILVETTPEGISLENHSDKLSQAM